MISPSATLGTLLRRLIELLDRDVEAAYKAAGLTWRPRYTPILRALMAEGEASIRSISLRIGITHSAVSQTVSQMARDGMVEMRSGSDARERIVALTSKAEAIIPALRRQWAATNAAANELDAQLSAPLSKVAAEAIEALTQRAFRDRIKHAAEAKAPQTQP